jgi:filamentous hemagglutinin
VINAGGVQLAGPIAAGRDVTIDTAAGGGVSVSASVSAGRTHAIKAGAGIGVLTNASLIAPTVRLAAAGPVSLDAGATLGQAGGVLDLSTSTGGISQNAAAILTAATLLSSGGVSGTASLVGTLNAVGTLGPFVASGAGADLVLVNTGSLHLAGPVIAPRDITLRSSAAISAAASVGAGRTLRLTADGGGFDLTAGATASAATVIIAATGPISLAPGATLGQAGARVDLSTTRGGISQAAGGTLLAEALTSSNGVIGAVALAGSANAVGTIAAFAVSGGGFGLTNTGNTHLGGPLTAPGTIAVATDAASRITVAGSVVAGAALSLSAGTGGLSLMTGAVVAGPTIDLRSGSGISLADGARLGQAGALIDLFTAAGGVTQSPGGAIVADLLRAPSGIADTVSALGTANAIARLGDVPVGNGGAFTLADTADLLVQGTVSASGISIVAPGITITGAALAQTASLSLTATTGAIVLNGAASAASTATLTASLGEIVNSGTILAGAGGITQTAATDIVQAAGLLRTPGSIGLMAGGAITQSGGTIDAGQTLTMTAALGSISQAGTIMAGAGGIIQTAASNIVQAAGLLRTPGSIGLMAGGAITQSGGTIDAGQTLTMTATLGAISQAGTVMAGAGGIIQTAASDIVQAAGLLRTPGSIGLMASGGLTTSGAMIAAQIHVTNPTGPIAIGGVITGLTPARLRNDSQFAIRDADFPTATEGTGVYITTSAGTEANPITVTADVAATSGRGQVLITIPNDTPTTLNVDSRNADLFLDLRAGSASGVVRVGSLHLRYQGDGTPDTVDLAGMVNGLAGYPAASASFILPSQLPNYTMNGCAIQAVACIQISDLRVPVSNPLKDVQTGRTGAQATVQFTLPDVAERDY